MNFCGRVGSAEDWRAAVSAILFSAPGAFLFWRIGNRKLAISVPDSNMSAADQSVATINSDWLINHVITVAPGPNIRRNRMTVIYANTFDRGRPATLTFPIKDSALDVQFLAEDSNVILDEETEARGIDNRHAAATFARTFLLLSRRSIYRFTVKHEGFKLDIGDVIKLEDPLTSVDQYVRIERIILQSNQTFSIVARHFVPSDYDYVRLMDAVEVAQDDDELTIPALDSLIATFDVATRKVDLVWEGDIDSFTTGFEIQLKIDAGDWTPLGVFLEHLRTAQYDVGFSVGEFTFRIRALADNIKSLWIKSNIVTVGPLAQSVFIRPVFVSPEFDAFDFTDSPF